ncbi:STAS domain-containing protein [candidate division KSB1 bacterium]|nr:STAS domain-containing protein [candidate division KSB1 bacterium]
MQFEKEDKNEITIIRIHEERLDSQVSPELKAYLLLLVEQGVDRVLVDISNVQYVDSSGLGALLFGLRQLRMFQGTLIIFGAQKRVLNLIRIAKLENILLHYDTEDEAIKSLSAEP